MIREYLKRVEAALASYQWVKTIQVLRCDIIETEQEQILTYRFRVALEGDGLLELMERVVHFRDRSEPNTTAYRFHWQGEDGQLVRRWDDSPHFPKIAGFPHHIHVRDGSVLSGWPITAMEMLTEVDRGFTDVVGRQ